MNRLAEYFADPPEPESDDDYFEIETHYDFFAISRETASEVERRLDQLPPPRWIAFRDLTRGVAPGGSRARLPRVGEHRRTAGSAARLLPRPAP